MPPRIQVVKGERPAGARIVLIVSQRCHRIDQRSAARGKI
jgi:hypothetical protein